MAPLRPSVNGESRRSRSANWRGWPRLRAYPGGELGLKEMERGDSMPVAMPVPDADVLKRRRDIVKALQAIVPGEGVIATEREMRPYESDGLTAYRQMPMVVVLPETVDQVARVLRYC